MLLRTLKLTLTGLVSLLTSSVLVNAASFSTDFGSGLPPGTSVAGPTPAFVEDGVLKITLGANGQGGAFTIDDFAGGIAVTNFRAKFKLLIGGGTCCAGADGITPRPADGMSLSFAAGIGGQAPGENGTGSGITISF